MKKLLLLLFFVPLLAFVKSDWVTVKLDDNASVSFPAQPIERSTSGMPGWILDLNKDARCVVLVMDLEELGIDSAQFASEIKEETGYQDFKNSMLGEMGDVSLISEKKAMLNGFITFEFKASVVPKDADGFNVYHIKNIFSGKKIYTIYFYEMKDKPMDDLRNRIFSSFKLK